MKEYAEAIMQIVAAADEFKPVVEQGSKALQSYGPDIYALFHRIAIGMADIKADTIVHLEGRGFTREEAILLTVDQWADVKKNLAQNKKRQS